MPRSQVKHSQLRRSEGRCYLLHLVVDKKVARDTFSVILDGLRFFYHKALGCDWKSLYVAKPRHAKTLRVVLSREEVWRILGAVRIDVYRVCSRTHQTRHLTLPAHAFLARFLQHVLPKGFQKIRGYGLFRPAATRRRERARHLLQLDPALPLPSIISSSPTAQPADDTPSAGRSRQLDRAPAGSLLVSLSPSRRLKIQVA